ncbi:methylated-DNA--[protein]-cysteine S-methyltransferase [Pseudonocardia bannensis]|uniref:Methylated-DNA--[protein]-cysteine S-methyltransferase n=1 Tax=Pseudonocardia bannensis TaxID=630973 RepID=A0A848DPL6_9PSEU|nr:methylated-DNA--[protein]-cysteine S-methyltransferase [Pseudonocardia bannensis]NMH94463.1 methylated-DNA--[protein]-cysteine S-methyltransferase [Pseudonocardia bannensis]
MTATATITHPTPAGLLTLAASASGLTRCTFRPAPVSVDGAGEASPAARRWLDLARRELDGYFTGRLREFTVPVDLRRVGTRHRRVLDGLAHVGYGETTTYGRLAAAVGLTDDGPRQVGGAMARNPVLIIVPCHRVLGAGGRLVGYAGGLTVKRRLLDLEGRDQAPQLDLGLAHGVSEYAQ